MIACFSLHPQRAPPPQGGVLLSFQSGLELTTSLYSTRRGLSNGAFPEPWRRLVPELFTVEGHEHGRGGMW